MGMNISTPLHVQLYEEMMRRIRTGEWRAGDKVPSEKALSEEFGTSRGPVRQAVETLRAQGMIVGGRGTPPRVQHTAPALSFDTFMTFTAWARQLGYMPGQRVIRVESTHATETQARELQLHPDAPLVEVVRLRTLDERPAMLERSLFPFHIGKPLLNADLSHDSIYETLGRIGIAPARARHIIDAVGAPALESEQLHVALGTPLLRVRRITYDERGSVLEAADARYLPSMASFVIDNAVEPELLRRPTTGLVPLVGR